MRENVIYLDFDGVMRTGHEDELHQWPAAQAALLFAPGPMVTLAEVCRDSRSSVTLSTSWRAVVTPQAWRAAWSDGLAKAGRADLPVPELFRQRLTCESCWKTPDYGWLAARGGEIRDHLHTHAPHIRAWAVVDDIPGMMLESQKPRTVVCGPGKLLGEEHRPQLMSLLG